MFADRGPRSETRSFVVGQLERGFRQSKLKIHSVNHRSPLTKIASVCKKRGLGKVLGSCGKISNRSCRLNASPMPWSLNVNSSANKLTAASLFRSVVRERGQVMPPEAINCNLTHTNFLSGVHSRISVSWDSGCGYAVPAWPLFLPVQVPDHRNGGTSAVTVDLLQRAVSIEEIYQPGGRFRRPVRTFANDEGRSHGIAVVTASALIESLQCEGFRFHRL